LRVRRLLSSAKRPKFQRTSCMFDLRQSTSGMRVRNKGNQWAVVSALTSRNNRVLIRQGIKEKELNNDNLPRLLFFYCLGPALVRSGTIRTSLTFRDNFSFKRLKTLEEDSSFSCAITILCRTVLRRLSEPFDVGSSG
jgi:hypothetical protein